jgi:hypothetical protein
MVRFDGVFAETGVDFVALRVWLLPARRLVPNRRLQRSEGPRSASDERSPSRMRPRGHLSPPRHCGEPARSVSGRRRGFEARSPHAA